MFAGQDTVSFVGDCAGGVATANCTGTVTTDGAPLMETVNDVWYVPVPKPEVVYFSVIVPPLVPLVPDTESQLAVGGTTDHFIARLPTLRISTTCCGALLPW
jgi:hypothetical protein